MIVNKIRILIFILVIYSCNNNSNFSNFENNNSFTSFKYKKLSLFNKYIIEVPEQVIYSKTKDIYGNDIIHLAFEKINLQCQTNAIDRNYIASFIETIPDSIKNDVILIHDTIKSSWLFSIDNKEGIVLCHFTDTTNMQGILEDMHANITIEANYNDLTEKELIVNTLKSLSKKEVD